MDPGLLDEIVDGNATELSIAWVPAGRFSDDV